MEKSKDQRNQRPRARLPKGFRDYFGPEVTGREEMLATIREVYHRYGFEPLESPAVETVEALGKFLPDVDRPNEGVFAWKEDESDWLALRYDLTAPLARVYAQFRNELPLPYRRYAVGTVWRNEKPGPGRFRQFYQCDADTVGSKSPAADAEMCMMLAEVLEAAGVCRGDYRVRLNSRAVLDGMLEKVGALNPDMPEDSERCRDSVFRAVDKLDRLGAQGVRALLGRGREDESGDFTRGAGLNEDQIEQIMEIVAPSNGNDDMLVWVRRCLPDSAVEDLIAIERLVRAQGFGQDRICIDTSVVRGLAYYTGAVFEADLTFEITDAKGRRQQFGSVAGGGRYDGLVRRFTGQDVAATGVSVGVDRLLAAVAARRGDASDVQGGTGPVVVTVMDRDRLDSYVGMVSELRAAGIRSEMYLGNPKNFGGQLRYADQRESPVAVIEGSDERKRDVVQLKDLVVGRMIAADLESSDAWRNQPAQITVPRGRFVEEVRRLVAVFELPPEDQKAEFARRRARYLDWA